MKITKDLYLSYLRKALAEGIDVADKFNKMALETKAISLDLYREAAQILAKAYLAQ